MNQTGGISVDSLTPSDKEGFMTKQGGGNGGWKNWKKRWFVLKGTTLFYFKTKKDKDVTGTIELDASSTIQPEPKKKGKYCFSVGTKTRVFFMYPDSKEEQDSWMNTLKSLISSLKGGSPTPAEPSGGKPVTQQERKPETKPDAPSGGKKPCDVLMKGVAQVPFLQPSDSKPLEFWEMWKQSIPEAVKTFNVCVALDLSQLSWRCIGPQQDLIQNMVDFFWNVGAPDTEIDRLNDVGTLINPKAIGSWIDMSAKGGMDGGWFFPSLIKLKMALEACDPSDASKKIAAWADTNGIVDVIAVGRDMGAAPPRQTNFRFVIPGESVEKQLEIALSAYDTFDFPKPPEEALDLIKQSATGLQIQVTSSSQGFVKIGILTPRPDAGGIPKLCSLSGGSDSELLAKFEDALGVNGVQFVEYQYLQKGFGYGVYKEGFDVVFHYQVGESYEV